MEHKILHRCIKDYNLPIPVYEEPYFSYYVNLFDKQFDIREKLKLTEEMANNFDTPEKFLDYYDEVKNKIIDKITHLDVYKEYLNYDLQELSKNTIAYKKNNLYIEPNNGLVFISLDLKKANYQALRYINPKLVLNTSSYEEFIKEFTPYDYMSNSKYLRQVIFGNLNPKRQSTIERYMIGQVLKKLIEENIIIEENIYSVLTDEILLTEISENNFEKLEESLKDLKELGIEITLEKFQLKAIFSEKDLDCNEKTVNKECYGFVKEFCIPETKTVEFKAVNSEYFPQVYKHYYGLEITENDLIFYHNHKKAKFLESIF